MPYREAEEDAGIASARRASARRAELKERLAAARSERDRLGEAMADGAASARREAKDVARLDGVGPRAIVAKLTGRYGEARQREVAEAEVAQRAYEEQRDEFHRASARVAELERELAAIGDVDRQMEAALAAHARRIHERGGAPAEALAAVEAAREELRARGRQLDEAIASGADASGRVLAIIHELATWRGGGDTGRNTHYSVGPDLPAMRSALAGFRLTLSRLPAGVVGGELPDIPEFSPDWTPSAIWSDEPGRRALERISAAVTDVVLSLEDGRRALRLEAAGLAAEWEALVVGS